MEILQVTTSELEENHCTVHNAIAIVVNTSHELNTSALIGATFLV